MQHADVACLCNRLPPSGIRTRRFYNALNQGISISTDVYINMYVCRYVGM